MAGFGDVSQADGVVGARFSAVFAGCCLEGGGVEEELKLGVVGHGDGRWGGGGGEQGPVVLVL